MTPVGQAHFAKAIVLLDTAQRSFDADLTDAAGHWAYLSVYHAVQAFVACHGRMPAKTHKGAKILFAEVTRNMTGSINEFRDLLPKLYSFKELADYDIGIPAGTPEYGEITAALDRARKFLKLVGELIAV